MITRHSHILHRWWARLTAVIMSAALALGLSLAVSTPSQAQTSMGKKEYLQLLAAQEKLSYDVLMDLAEVHDRGPFVIMARAEERDLKRIRRLLRLHGWEDLTKGDVMGEFTHFPTMEQMYEDMLTDGQYTVGDGARVGIALQQITLATIYELQDFKLLRRDRARINETRSYSLQRMATFLRTVSIYG